MNAVYRLTSPVVNIDLVGRVTDRYRRTPKSPVTLEFETESGQVLTALEDDVVLTPVTA